MRKINYMKVETIRQELGLKKNEMALCLAVSPRQYSIWGSNGGNDVPDRRVIMAEELLEKGKPDSVELKILRSNYEVYRMNVLTNFCLEANRFYDELGIETSNENIQLLKNLLENRFNFAFIYALSKRMCPYFEQNSDENDPFEDVYSINKNLMKSVIDICVDYDIKNSSIDFYEIENEYGKDYRYEILIILKYLKLNSKLTKNFYTHLSEGFRPAEAHSLEKWEFDPFEIKIGDYTTV